MSALAVLFGAAYSMIGFYVAHTVSDFSRYERAFDAAMIAWLAAGAVLLGTWALRWSGISPRAGAR